MRAWGIDPSGHVIGLACAARDDTGYRFAALTPIRVSADTGTPAWYRAVANNLVLLRTAGESAAAGGPVLIERPAETARADVKHGHQAVVGFGIGRVVGAICTMFAIAGAEIEEVGISDWRNLAEGEVLRLTTDPAMALEMWLRPPSPVRLPGPGRLGIEKLQRTGKQLTALYRCGHTSTIRSVEDMFTGDVAPQCPQCTRLPKGMDAAEYRRDRYKAWAVEAVRRLHVEAWDELVRDARSRATKEDKETREAHRLAGVSDVCEAALIAVAAIARAGRKQG